VTGNDSSSESFLRRLWAMVPEVELWSERAAGESNVRSRRADASDAIARPLRIAFLVRAMERGGAERQLLVLAKGLHNRGHDVVVMVFRPDGPLDPELRAAGVRVRVVGKGGRWDIVRFIARLHRAIREERPDILHSYMPDSNIVAAALRPAIRGVRVVWGLRASNMDMADYDLVSRLVGRVSTALSKLPCLAIVNSRAGFAHFASLGYPAERMRVIPNGIDTEHFTIDRSAGRAVRAAWGIRGDERLVGLVARVDPVKAHATFLHAASLLAADHADVRFACVGDVGDVRYADAMRSLAGELGLGERLLWVGGRPDMRAVYNAFDVACLSSSSEGFPNVIAEAMACGLPCVSTDVGDAAWLLGDTALIAPVGDASAFAERIARLLDRTPDDRARLGVAARERVASFSVAKLIGDTERTLSELVRHEPPRGEKR
jgi:glycosyltransferase involved in cell wall biosynthesis